jgi:hypothetical protein
MMKINKNAAFLLVMTAVLSTTIFAQESKPKHSAGDMSITIGTGMKAQGMGAIGKVIDGVTTSDMANMVENIVSAFDVESTAVDVGLGVGFEYYILNWLNVGGMVGVNGGVVAGQPPSDSNALGIGAPLWLSLPVSVNVNIPVKHLEWIYVGLGVQFDILLADLLDGVGLFDKADINNTLNLNPGNKYSITGLASGQFTLFQDIGFDFIRYNKNDKRKGGRFIIRLSEGLAAFSEGAWEKGFGYGFFWNTTNIKLNK